MQLIDRIITDYLNTVCSLVELRQLLNKIVLGFFFLVSFLNTAAVVRLFLIDYSASRRQSVRVSEFPVCAGAGEREIDDASNGRIE